MLNGIRFDLFRNPVKLIKKGDSLERNIRVYGLEWRAAHSHVQAEAHVMCTCTMAKQWQTANTKL